MLDEFEGIRNFNAPTFCQTLFSDDSIIELIMYGPFQGAISVIDAFDSHKTLLFSLGVSNVLNGVAYARVQVDDGPE